MAKLLYSAITSLDGYTADADGDFSWSMPDAEVHAAVNEAERSVGTYLLGRRMYEVMRYWEGPETLADPDPIARDFASIWQAADKIVYSSTLTRTSTTRSRIERTFEPASIERLKREATRDISIGGPTIASAALLAGLVDEVSLYVSPIIIGNGLRALPHGLRLNLELIEERRFSNGVIFLRYRPE